MSFLLANRSNFDKMFIDFHYVVSDLGTRKLLAVIKSVTRVGLKKLNLNGERF